jgi:Cu+-exporting ATPase
MAVPIETAKHMAEHDGKAFYFCCAGCKQAFEKQPEKYVLAHLST